MDATLSSEIPSWLVRRESSTRSPSSVQLAHASPDRAAQPMIVNDAVLVGVSGSEAGETTLPTSRNEADETALQAMPQPAGAPVVVLRPLQLPKERFELRQQWEGTVQAIQGDDIVAVLRDLTDPDRPEEEAVIGFDDVSADDRPLVSPGAIFYWSIGYRTSRLGQVERISAIRFRRLPAWSKRDVARIRQRAAELVEIFGVADEGRSSGTG